jgi:hypothetical protein
VQQDPADSIHLPSGCADVKVLVQPFAQLDPINQGRIARVEGVGLEGVEHGPRVGRAIGQEMTVLRLLVALGLLPLSESRTPAKPSGRITLVWVAKKVLNHLTMIFKFSTYIQIIIFNLPP